MDITGQTGGQFDPFEDQTYYNNECFRAVQLIAELERR
jgi:hypothetical protein